jgi:hypothetical protein
MIDYNKIKESGDAIFNGINEVKKNLNTLGDKKLKTDVNLFITEALTAMKNGNIEEAEKVKDKVLKYVDNIKNGN